MEDHNTMFLAFSMLVSLATWFVIHRWGQRFHRGPKTWPVIGATIEQIVNYDRMHDWLVDYLKELKTVTVPMLSTTFTYTADPANVEYILKSNFNNYPKGKLYASCMDVLLGDGIFNSDGEMWKKQRKTASFEFASKNLRDFSTTVFRDYATVLASILCQASVDNQDRDMQDLFMRMTLDSICKVGFGVEIGTLSPHLPENPFARAFDEANATVTLRFIDPFWRLKRLLRVGKEAHVEENIKVVNDFTYDVIRRRKAEIKRDRENGIGETVKHDILSRFIEVGEEQNSSFSDDKSLRDVVLNFVIAGRDTTATTLSWFIHMIMNHPSIAEKLYSELKQFEEERAEEERLTLIPYDADDLVSFNNRISQFAGLLSYDTLGKLVYLHACITETLRLYPAVPQDPKGIVEDDILPDGTTVKAGGIVTYAPYAMGRMKYIWGTDAETFEPDRWFRDGALQNISPFKFTAFQAGPRMCLGKDSAYLQMKMTLAILCRFYKFTLVLNHPVNYKMMTILSMAHGLKLHVSRRK